MSWCSKKRSDNEKAVIQRWFVIALQKTQDFNENSEEKKDEKDIKKINWLDLSRNHKRVDDATKFNSVALQAWKRRHCTSCNKLESLSSSRKISDMSEENRKLSACSA